MNDEITDSLRNRIVLALERAPVSRRALAQWAGVSHTTLNRLYHLQVERVDSEVARRIAIALVLMSDELRAGALGIQEVLREGRSDREGRDE